MKGFGFHLEHKKKREKTHQQYLPWMQVQDMYTQREKQPKTVNLSGCMRQPGKITQKHYQQPTG
jgi:hypothetical protein